MIQEPSMFRVRDSIFKTNLLMSLLAIRFPLTVISNFLDYLPAPKFVGKDFVK